ADSAAPQPAKPLGDWLLQNLRCAVSHVLVWPANVPPPSNSWFRRAASSSLRCIRAARGNAQSLARFPESAGLEECWCRANLVPSESNPLRESLPPLVRADVRWAAPTSIS